MFVKYVMLNVNDYRGNVRLVVRNEQSQEIAYTSVEVTDNDMVQLTQAEIDLVLERSPGVWYTKRNEYILNVDTLADEIRQSHLEVGTETIDLEYKQVEEELLAWQAAGSDPNNVPADIAVWQQATGESLAWVVNDIETQIANYKAVISSIRSVRLLGKQTLRDALIENLDTEYATIVADLEALRGGPNDPNAV